MFFRVARVRATLFRLCLALHLFHSLLMADVEKASKRILDKIAA